MSVMLEALDKIIENEAIEKRVFSSVSIANIMKKSGYWYGSMQTAKHLRSWIQANLDRYDSTIVDVSRSEDGKKVQTSVYHPVGKSLSGIDVTEKAITPVEFALFNLPLSLPKVTPKTPFSTLNQSDGGATILPISKDNDSSKKKTVQKEDKDTKKASKPLKETVSETTDSPKKKEKAVKKESVAKKAGSRDYAIFNFI